MKHTFYKENGMWYIDLPQFLEAGLGTKNNLLMVAGADYLLDRLSKHKENQTPDGTRITLQIDTKKFDDYDTSMNFLEKGKDDEYLNSVGHAPIEYGAYYVTNDLFGDPHCQMVWLCPVTEYVFAGEYPRRIFAKVIG